MLITGNAIEKRDISRINKLNQLKNKETFWDDVRKLTKRVYSDHSIRRWECLSETRWNELCVSYEDMLVDGLFTSVWDGGYAITTKCKVDTITKEVFVCETEDVGDSVDVLDKEYITIDGIDYPVSCNRERDTEYWYR